MPTSLIIHASARSNGNTMQICQQLQQELSADLIDLADYEIGFFRYDQQYPDTDQFLATVEAKILLYDELIFASPVYWYSMSAQMKVFIDRLSDLLKSRRDLGRQLRGKSLSVLSCSGDDEAFESFYLPFRLSADYLGMPYGREWHSWINAEGKISLIKQR